MSGFSADWLALREPFDRAARAASSAAFAWPALRGLRAGDAPLCVLDLGCGTGANLREVAPRLGGVQRWVLVDHDPALLGAVPVVLSSAGFRVEIKRRCVDLALGLDGLPWADVQIVTASALLDLVSAPWLEALVGHCRAAGAAVLWALSVDGCIEWSPPDAGDEAVHALFGAHQRRDKGFSGGPALGSDAVAVAAALLAAAGYRVTQAPSDWNLDATHSPADLALLRAMVDGIAQAAAQQDPAQSSTVAAWRARRIAQLAVTRLRVGHQDLLALL